MIPSLLLRGKRELDDALERRIEPRLDAPPPGASEVFDSGRKTVVDCAHVRVERLDTHPVLFSKVFKEFEDRQGQKYDYRYWAERENYFLREFLKKQSEFTHVVQARHLISENEAAKQVLTCDAGITVANWLRVKSRYADTATLSHPFQRSDAFLRLIRACLVALREIHEHRIVHCDIKEDNICIPFAPNPYPGEGHRIRLEYEKLKLIDFAFSVAHAIPLTQILVIDPGERLPYQSELLISALRADRRSGSPNAVQQLDYRVDLFSLGHMAEKLSAGGLDCPAAPGGGKALDGIQELVRKLKDFERTPASDTLPHAGLIAEIDRLLLETARLSTSLDFEVDGEWSAQEMERGQGARRKTPSTPIAVAPPTPVSPPLAAVPAPQRRHSHRRIALFAGFAGVALALAAGSAFLVLAPAPDAGSQRANAFVAPAPRDAAADAGKRIAAKLHGGEDGDFRNALGELAELKKSDQPAAKAIAAAAAKEYGDALAPGPLPGRSLAMRRLGWMAQAGDQGAVQRITAFEKSYDELKQTVARSAWWLRGEDAQPAVAALWIENGALLAETGDRPAMLDVAFAMAYGRVLQRDRVASARTYLNVIDHSGDGDAASLKIRQAAVRGLASLLNTIAAQADEEAARGVLPMLRAKADAGAADLQYYSGLLSECALRPADLVAARQWYGKAAADPVWKSTAEQKALVLGSWCPH